MLIEMKDRADIHLILPALKGKVPLCGDTAENIAIGVLKGDLNVLLSYNDDEVIEGFCIYRRFADSSAFVYAVYAPGVALKRKRVFFEWLREREITRLRWASKLSDAVWGLLTPGCKKLWSVWEWDVEEEHEGNNESGR